MSRTGFSTTPNVLRLGSAVVSAVPFSMGCWARANSIGAAMVLMGIFKSTAVNLRDEFTIQTATDDSVGALTADSAGLGTAGTAASLITINTWFHVLGVFASATSRAVYFNGANKATDATNKAPAGLDRTSIGLQDNAANSKPFDGLIAEPTIWSGALTDADALMLGSGISSLLVRPELRAAYWPLIGQNSPENNRVSNSAMLSIVGALSAGVHPRILRPRR